jgi:hypothetical protein
MDGTVFAQAALREWGATDRRGLGYLPAVLALGGDELTEDQILAVGEEGAVRLRVQTVDREEHVLVIPIEFDPGTSGVDPVATEDLALLNVAPNPASGATSVLLRLPQAAEIRLGVFDVRGRRVAELASGRMTAGAHVVPWSGRDLNGEPVPSGVYFVRLLQGGRSETRSLHLVR